MTKEMPDQNIDPKIKKEISEEGFEMENEDGGAAVLIGKQEEMPHLLEKLEKEGGVKDLGSYMRLNKEVKVPHKEIKWDTKSKLNKGMYWTNIAYPHGPYKRDPGLFLQYIDHEKNIVEILIKSKKINDLKEEIEERFTSHQGGIREEDKAEFDEFFNKLKESESSNPFLNSEITEEDWKVIGYSREDYEKDMKNLFNCQKIVEENLKKLGFSSLKEMHDGDEIKNMISDEESNYEYKIQKLEGKRKKEEFDY